MTPPNIPELIARLDFVLEGTTGPDIRAEARDALTALAAERDHLAAEGVKQREQLDHWVALAGERLVSSEAAEQRLAEIRGRFEERKQQDRGQLCQADEIWRVALHLIDAAIAGPQQGERHE